MPHWQWVISNTLEHASTERQDSQRVTTARQLNRQKRFSSSNSMLNRINMDFLFVIQFNFMEILLDILSISKALNKLWNLIALAETTAIPRYSDNNKVFLNSVGHFDKCSHSQDFTHMATEHTQTLAGPWGPGKPVPGGSEQDKVPSSG